MEVTVTTPGNFLLWDLSSQDISAARPNSVCSSSYSPLQPMTHSITQHCWGTTFLQPVMF